MKILNKITLSTVILTMLVVPNLVLAQSRIEFLAPLPGFSRNIPDVPNYISGIYSFGLGIAGLLAMLMIIWGALEYTISGAIDRKADAKSRIWQAILGLIILLVSVMILRTINPSLTEFIPPPPQSSSSSNMHYLTPLV